MENTDRTIELGITELTVVEYRNRQYVAENVVEVERCNHCQFTHISFNEIHQRHLLDGLISDDKISLIELIHRHKHFICQSMACGKHVEKRITFAERNHDYTCRLERYLFRFCLKYPAHQIEKSLGGRITDTSIKKVFSDVSKKLDKTLPKHWETPKAIGVHAELVKGLRFWLVTNIDKECLVDILPDCSEDTIMLLFKRFNIKKIEKVWIDMDDQLLMSVRSVVPEEKIRVCKYQLRRLAKRLISDKVKKIDKSRRPTEQVFTKKLYSELSKKTAEKLDACLEDNDELKRLYELYWTIPEASPEQLRAIIDQAKNNPGFGSRFDWSATVTNFYKYIVRSIGDAMTNADGDDIADPYFSLINDNIEENLEKTRKCSADVMRARILYSDMNLNEEFKYLYADIGAVQEDKSENTMYCMRLIEQNYLFASPQDAELKKRKIVGQPLRDVASRLEWLVSE